ncbi:MAG: hypothetical protein R3Y35_03960 [Clostridia bacterium]
MANICEALMVCAFGFSWPINAYKSFKSKSAEGKSLLFSVIILIGYFFGITGKICTDQINYVFVFYIINVCFVLLDLAISLNNKYKYSKPLLEKGLN